MSKFTKHFSDYGFHYGIAFLFIVIVVSFSLAIKHENNQKTELIINYNHLTDKQKVIFSDMTYREIHISDKLKVIKVILGEEE